MSFTIRGYYDDVRRGLAEFDEVETYEEAVEIVHEYCSNGSFVTVSNGDKTLEFDPDEWMEAIEFGDYPDRMRELAWGEKDGTEA